MIFVFFMPSPSALYILPLCGAWLPLWV